MATLIKDPAQIKNDSKGKKIIEEYIGKVNSNQKDISIAVMNASEGWEEPGQVAKFVEYIYVISGRLFVKTKKNDFVVKARETIVIEKGEWVQFSTPFKYGANYIAICTPAFQNSLVKRDDVK